MDTAVKKLFTPKPMISLHSARWMSSYFVRAKLYPEERTKVSLNVVVSDGGLSKC